MKLSQPITMYFWGILSVATDENHESISQTSNTGKLLC